MHKFYEGCLYCAFQKQASCERCFECAEIEAIREGWIHSLGFYFSRCREEHKDSKWSQAVIRLKRNCKGVAIFGRIAAFYMDARFSRIKPYLITGMPKFESGYLFKECSPMQILARSVFNNLKDTKWISIENVLIQRKPKTRKQHSCRTDIQRIKNIKDVYAVQNPESIKGRNIVLMDDIVTSGATMKECAATLLEAGAKDVIGLTLARTFRKGEENGNQT